MTWFHCNEAIAAVSDNLLPCLLHSTMASMLPEVNTTYCLTYKLYVQ